MPLLSSWCVLALSEAHASGFRVFTSSDGKPLEAKVLSMTGQKVTLERAADGKAFTLPVKRFSAGDQTYLKAWKPSAKKGGKKAEPTKKKGKQELSVHPEPPRIEVKVSSNKRIEKTNISLDDKKMSVKFELAVKSLERGMELEGLKVNCFVFGRGVDDNNELKVICRDDHEIGLKYGTEVELMGEKQNLMYDNRGYATYGHSYLGHVVVVRDSQNRIIFKDAAPVNLGENIAALLEFRTGKIFQRSALNSED